MKLRETAKQQNVLLDTASYTRAQVDAMYEAKEIWCLSNEEFKAVYHRVIDELTEREEPRIATDELVEIKVVNENGWYETVAIGKNGKKYYVVL